MQWESTGGHGRGAVSPSRRHVGVLEVKMKHRLQEDHQAVAIGCLAAPSSPKARGPRAKKRRHHEPLPSLLDAATAAHANSRPISFEAERQEAMNAAALPSPTRTLIQRHVTQSKQQHARALEALPPVAGAFRRRPVPGGAAPEGGLKPTPHSLFPQAYQRGELPIMMEPRAGGQTIRWTQELGTLDLGVLLPLFLDGLREPAFPLSFLAREGATQLVAFGREHPERVLACLPRVVTALRGVLETRDPGLLRVALRLLQELTAIEGLGLALVPYYRQLLPVLNLFKSKRRNLGDAIDFQQHSTQDLGELIVETLERLERTGGPDAYVNIKYMVPTYEGAGAGGGGGGRRA